MRSLCSLLLCISLLTPLITAGCANHSMGTLADLHGPFSERSVSAAIDVLARAGVAVYEAPDSKEPVRPVEGVASPLRFTRWQARNLALQVSGGGGYLGSQLDKVIATPRKVPSFSFTLAAWIARYHGAGAKQAKELMGKQDWRRAPNVVFPALVLALFLADLTRSGRQSAGSSGGGAPLLAMIPVSEALKWNGPSGRQIAYSDPCSTAASFLEGTINDVVAALQITSSSKDEILKFLKFLWNIGIRIVGGILMVVINNVLKPLTEVLQGIATALGVITQVVSALHSWDVAVLPHAVGEPNKVKPVMRFRVGNEWQNQSEYRGIFIASVDTGSAVPWPEWLAGCAAHYGVDLNATSTADSTVSWRINSGIPELAHQGPNDPRSSRITAESGLKEAYFGFETNSESAETAAKGKLNQDVLSVEVSITRLQLEKLKVFVENLFMAQLPQKLSIEVYPYFKRFVTPLEDKLLDLINHPVDAPGAVIITFHDQTPVVHISPTPGHRRAGVCGLLSNQTASAVIGSSMEPHEMPPNMCVWYSPDGPEKEGMIAVDVAPAVPAGHARLQVLGGLLNFPKRPPTQVDVGDAATWFPHQDGSPGHELIVAQGVDTLIHVQLKGRPGEVSPGQDPQDLDKAIAVAREILRNNQ